MTRRVFLSMGCLAALCVMAQAADKKMAVEISQDAKMEWRWKMMNGEGATVATSGQGYKAKADCKNMIDNFQKDIKKYKFEVYEDKGGEFRFRINASNGNTVGSSSKGYKAKADAQKVIEAIEKGIKDAAVTEVKAEKK